MKKTMLDLKNLLILLYFSISRLFYIFEYTHITNQNIIYYNYIFFFIF